MSLKETNPDSELNHTSRFVWAVSAVLLVMAIMIAAVKYV